MLGKLQRSKGLPGRVLPHAKGIPLGKGCLWHGQNRTGQFSLYQTRLDTLVSPKVRGTPWSAPKGSLPQRDAFGMGKDSFGGDSSPKVQRTPLGLTTDH